MNEHIVLDLKLIDSALVWILVGAFLLVSLATALNGLYLLLKFGNNTTKTAEARLLSLWIGRVVRVSQFDNDDKPITGVLLALGRDFMVIRCCEKCKTSTLVSLRNTWSIGVLPESDEAEKSPHLSVVPLRDSGGGPRDGGDRPV